MKDIKTGVAKMISPFRFLLLLTIILFMVLPFVSLGQKSTYASEDKQRFFVVQEFPIPCVNDVICDRETKVLYAVSFDGTLTVLVDADGKPLLYEGDAEDY